MWTVILIIFYIFTQWRSLVSIISMIWKFSTLNTWRRDSPLELVCQEQEAHLIRWNWSYARLLPLSALWVVHALWGKHSSPICTTENTSKSKTKAKLCYLQKQEQRQEDSWSTIHHLMKNAALQQVLAGKEVFSGHWQQRQESPEEWRVERRKRASIYVNYVGVVDHILA